MFPKTGFTKKNMKVYWFYFMSNDLYTCICARHCHISKYFFKKNHFPSTILGFCSGNRPKMFPPGFSIPSHRSQPLLGYPQIFPSHHGNIISPAHPKSVPGSPSIGTWYQSSWPGAFFKVLEPPQLTLLQGSPGFQRSSPYHGVHLQPYSFSPYRCLVSTGWPVNRQLYL